MKFLNSNHRINTAALLITIPFLVVGVIALFASMFFAWHVTENVACTCIGTIVGMLAFFACFFLGTNIANDFATNQFDRLDALRRAKLTNSTAGET